MKSLTIIGCGRMGSTLAKLWQDNEVFEVNAILNRHIESAERARNFIGAGKAVQDFSELGRSEVWLLSVPDDQISETCSHLVDAGVLAEGNLVMHTSGVHSSANLGPAWASRAVTASLYPLKIISDPESAVNSFNDTLCTLEGDDKAKIMLQPAIESIGGKVLNVDSQKKPLQQAGISIIQDYVSSVVSLGIAALERSGIPQDEALKAVRPLVYPALDRLLNSDQTTTQREELVSRDFDAQQKQSQAFKCELPEYEEAFHILRAFSTRLSPSERAGAQIN